MWTLSCGVWDLVPGPRPLHWELQVLAAGPPVESQVFLHLKQYFNVKDLANKENDAIIIFKN